MTVIMPRGRQENTVGIDAIKRAASAVELFSEPLVVPDAGPREPETYWQIVITGALDARQFGPNWFRIIGLIDENEAEVGLKSMTAVTVPNAPGVQAPANLMQFDVGAFAGAVVHDRWAIQTVKEENRQRIVDIAATVFTRLNEVYVSAFGINRNWVQKLSKLTARNFLGTKLSNAGLAFPKGDASGQISYECKIGESRTTIQLAPAGPDDKWLGVFYNRHHPINYPDKFTYVDVGTQIREAADVDWKTAEQYGSDLAAQIKLTEGGQ
jgi:hypothetical protein